MNEPWFILTNRFGADIRNPTSDVMQRAIQEVVAPAHAADTEHTSAFVRYGFDDGPMCVLTYDSTRRLSFEQWADPDFEAELAPAEHLVDVLPAEAFKLMQELGGGAVDEVKQRAWLPGR